MFPFMYIIIFAMTGSVIIKGLFDYSKINILNHKPVLFVIRALNYLVYILGIYLMVSFFPPSDFADCLKSAVIIIIPLLVSSHFVVAGYFKDKGVLAYFNIFLGYGMWISFIVQTEAAAETLKAMGG